jgi:hypothetical protein
MSVLIVPLMAVLLGACATMQGGRPQVSIQPTSILQAPAEL